MKKADVPALAPSLQWEQFSADTRSPNFQTIVLSSPEYFKAIDHQVRDASLEDWKAYLEWQLLDSEAPLLASAFLKENFDFYGRTLTGAKEMRPRWKRCVDFTANQSGEALAKKYVEKNFGAAGKERTLKMVHALEKALGEDIEKLPWMAPDTKKEALVKLQAITNKIGYPDKWRDYSSVEIKRDDAIGNAFRADQFEFQRQLDKIGKPVDRLEWNMTPPTVNAYYDPQMNNINFPAGILQPPFFDNAMDDAVNFGGIGMVIAHDVAHGFDDEVRQFDLKGNLQDWWTPA